MMMCLLKSQDGELIMTLLLQSHGRMTDASAADRAEREERLGSLGRVPMLLLAEVRRVAVEFQGVAAELGPDAHVCCIAGEMKLEFAGVLGERCELGRAGLRVGARLFGRSLGFLLA